MSSKDGVPQPYVGEDPGSDRCILCADWTSAEAHSFDTNQICPTHSEICYDIWYYCNLYLDGRSVKSVREFTYSYQLFYAP
jgi:hypothetical protein